MVIREPTPSIVVFSDVDAVLRDPHLPAFTTAAAAFKQLAQDEAIVLCSGKTRAELEFVQQKLDISHPFICENGAAALIPGGYFDFDVPNARGVAGYQVAEFGRTYTDVVAALHRAADRLRIRVVGFSDMSIEEVARECQLPLLQARLAKLREYEEPFRLLDPGSTARSRLVRALETASLRCTSGGRFDRVGAPVDKAVGVNLLKSLFRRERPDLMTIGVTHTTPDDNLLRLVDHAIMAADDDEGEAIDVVDWAEAIVDRVKELRAKGPTSLPAATTRDIR